MQRQTDRIRDSELTPVEYALDRAPAHLAAALVRLTRAGASGELWARLRESDDRADEAIAEVITLYLYAADRTAAEYFALIAADSATRDLFFNETAAETVRLMRQEFEDADQAGRFATKFGELLDQRRSEYGRCREMIRTHKQSLDDTVVFSFYKHLLAFGSETAVFVMSEIQPEQVEVEVANAFAAVADRLSFLEEAAEEQTSEAAPAN